MKVLHIYEVTYLEDQFKTNQITKQYAIEEEQFQNAYKIIENHLKSNSVRLHTIQSVIKKGLSYPLLEKQGG